MGMKESRPSVIIRREITTVTRTSGFKGLFYESTDTTPSFSAFCQTSLVLPIRLFFTEPIVFLASIMASTSSAVIYLFPEAFPVVFKVAFGYSLRQCSLVNLAIPVGVLFTFLPRLYDIRVSNDCRRRNITAQPEDKIFGFLVAAPILAVAFWWFGLTVPPLTTGLSPWIPIASLTLVGFSVVEFDTVLAGYLTDTYTSHAALPHYHFFELYFLVYYLCLDIAYLRDLGRTMQCLFSLGLQHCIAALRFCLRSMESVFD
jgi:hypothetical protein